MGLFTNKPEYRTHHHNRHGNKNKCVTKGTPLMQQIGDRERRGNGQILLNNECHEESKAS